MKQLLVETITADPMAERGHQVLDRPADRRAGNSARAVKVGQALEQRFDLVLRSSRWARPSSVTWNGLRTLHPGPLRSGPCPEAASASDK